MIQADWLQNSGGKKRLNQTNYFYLQSLISNLRF